MKILITCGLLLYFGVYLPIRYDEVLNDGEWLTELCRPVEASFLLFWSAEPSEDQLIPLDTICYMVKEIRKSLLDTEPNPTGLLKVVAIETLVCVGVALGGFALVILAELLIRGVTVGLKTLWNWLRPRKASKLKSILKLPNEPVKKPSALGRKATLVVVGTALGLFALVTVVKVIILRTTGAFVRLCSLIIRMVSGIKDMVVGSGKRLATLLGFASSVRRNDAKPGSGRASLNMKRDADAVPVQVSKSGFASGTRCASIPLRIKREPDTAPVWKCGSVSVPSPPLLQHVKAEVKPEVDVIPAQMSWKGCSSPRSVKSEVDVLSQQVPKKECAEIRRSDRIAQKRADPIIPIWK